jgi:hypothetical protein
MSRWPPTGGLRRSSYRERTRLHRLSWPNFLAVPTGCAVAATTAAVVPLTRNYGALLARRSKGGNRGEVGSVALQGRSATTA